ncbi:MAG: hypothetical protein ACXW32_08005 [Limisphaerales bacterium]
MTPPALPPTTITKPALYRICTANPQISVKPFPSFPDVTVFSGAAREFHALKMLTSVPLYRLVFRKSTFTKPALYRGFLHCTAKQYFFRETRLAPFSLTSQSSVSSYPINNRSQSLKSHRYDIEALRVHSWSSLFRKSEKGLKRVHALDSTPSTESKRRLASEGTLGKLGYVREGKHIQASLGLAGEIHQDHAHDIAGVTITVAGDHHAVAVDFFTGTTDHIDGHFGPERKRLPSAKLKAVLSDANIVCGEGELGPIFLRFNCLENPRGV